MRGRSDKDAGKVRPPKKKGGDGRSGPKDASPGKPRSERIVTIKETYDNGKYVVEPKTVADKMVADAVREIRSRKG